MKILLYIVLLSVFYIGIAGMMTPEDNFWSEVECAGKEVNLMANTRTVVVPTLYITDMNTEDLVELPLTEGFCYSEVSCVYYQEQPMLHFVESACGNAFEVYYLLDLETLYAYELDYMTARNLGIIDY